MLAPLGVQVDPADVEEVHAAMHSWHSMKDNLGPGERFQELCKKPQDRNLFAWGLKQELDKSVWAEGKKEAKLQALGLLPSVLGDGGKVLGVVSGSKTTAGARVGRPKGSGMNRSKGSCKADSPSSARKAAAAKKAARRGCSSPNAAAARAKADAAAGRAADSKMSKEPTERLMLQLFPIDASTRAALVAGGFNPHLELTFRAKKSVIGLMNHLKTKWAAATRHLPAGVNGKDAVLQLYPFEAASATETVGAWNDRHDGVTATDIFDACGRPAAFRVRYGWVPSAEAASRPHLAPPPPPVHQQSVASRNGSRSRSRSASPPNLSPRKRSAEELDVRHPSFCQAPVQPGSFEWMFAGGARVPAVGSVLGADFGGDAAFGLFAGGGAVQGDDFTLSGFGGADFSNICREMGLDDGEHDRREDSAHGRAGDAPGPLDSASPVTLKAFARHTREVISEFGAAPDASMGAGGVLGGDFSLTTMLGDVPAEGGVSRQGDLGSPRRGTDSASAEPTDFSGMFGGDVA